MDLELVNIAQTMSLSARRAWIEMFMLSAVVQPAKPSLSARRAWIEIERGMNMKLDDIVALRKESVDRNE